jgi:hypothetical protein
MGRDDLDLFHVDHYRGDAPPATPGYREQTMSS